MNIPAYASLPMIPEIAALCDAGAIEDYDNTYLGAFIDKLTEK